MTTHIHTGYISSGMIRCTACGESLESIEEEILTAQSAFRAKRVQDEVAAAGGYTVTGFEADSVVYSKSIDGLIIELLVRKVKDREYVVIKRTREGVKVQDTS